MITNSLAAAYTHYYQAIQKGRIENDESIELSRILQQNPHELVKELELLDKIKALNCPTLSDEVDKIRSLRLELALKKQVDDLRKLLDEFSITHLEKKGELIALWINTSYETEGWPSLKIENLSKEELKAAAPHLLYVHPKCTVDLDDLEMKGFLDQCKNATHLFFSGNEKVRNLALTNSSNTIESITITDMPQLVKIVVELQCELKALTLLNMPQLREIKFGHNFKLKELEMRNAPLLEKLEILYCHQLTTIKDSLPTNIDFTSTESLSMEWKDFIENPIKALLAIENSYSLKYGAFPNIYFKNQPKHNSCLIPLICKHLFKKRDLFPTAPLFGGKMPLAFTGNAQALQTIAKLIGICANTGELMGTHLPPILFSAILSLTNEEIDSIEPNKPLNENLKKKLYISLNNEEDFCQYDADAL